MCALEEKREALLKVIAAYLERGSYIQYDQRCMDRSLMLTPRRIKLISPEAATEQKTVYLDCSSYVGAVFYEAFGYELPADLTWHMIDYVCPRVYFCEFTREKTDEEKQKIEREMRSLLEVGDVITYDRGVGSGHTMLYIGDGRFTHCTSRGPDSYDYINKRSREYEGGGLSVADLSTLFNDKRLFSPKSRRVAVSRPLELVGEPTENTLARLTAARGLYIEVLTSHFGMINAQYGEKIEFRLRITETEGRKRAVKASLSLPNTAKIIGESEKCAEIGAGEGIELSFCAAVLDRDVSLLCGASFTVEGLSVSAPQVLIGDGLFDNERKAVRDFIKRRDGAALELASKAYGELGIAVEPSERRIFQKLFYLHDAPTGDVLSRREQLPQIDGAVYSLFGGTGVVTPEMISHPFIRVNQIRISDILAGDIIVVSDDATADKAYSVVCTGDALIGKLEANGISTAIAGKAAREFIDSLMGRFAFVVLRPSLTKTQNRGK